MFFSKSTYDYLFVWHLNKKELATTLYHNFKLPMIWKYITGTVLTNSKRSEEVGGNIYPIYFFTSNSRTSCSNLPNTNWWKKWHSNEICNWFELLYVAYYYL